MPAPNTGRVAANEPPYEDHAARREWFRALQQVTERLRPLVADQLPGAEPELRSLRILMACEMAPSAGRGELTATRIIA